MNPHPQPALTIGSDLLDRRYQPRFKLAVEIRVHSKVSGLVKGQTVDISESGVSAILRNELGVGELVELDFSLPFGRVNTYAIVRQRSAFRYGFHFAESNCIDKIIRPTCRTLALGQQVSEKS